MTIIEQLKQEIQDREAKIKLIQAQCSHPSPAVTVEYRQSRECDEPVGFAGKYNERGTCWCHCSLCDSHWGEEVNHGKGIFSETERRVR